MGSWGHRVGLDREEKTPPVLLSDRVLHARCIIKAEVYIQVTTWGLAGTIVNANYGLPSAW